ncbi:MAG: hypothetical protein ACOY0T_37355 [Myxococcota bacterium]
MVRAKNVIATGARKPPDPKPRIRSLLPRHRCGARLDHDDRRAVALLIEWSASRVSCSFTVQRHAATAVRVGGVSVDLWDGARTVAEWAPSLYRAARRAIDSLEKGEEEGDG